MILRKTDALLIVDVQNDFLPGGVLPVPKGNRIIPVINRIIGKFPIVIASQDWHPPNHDSFKSQGGIRPPHCIKGKKGADFHRQLKIKYLSHIVRKATQKSIQTYSAFGETGLENLLNGLKVRRLFVCGLATDLCVRETTFDALKSPSKRKVFVIKDAVAAVNLNPKDEERSIQEMKNRGALFVYSSAMKLNK